MNTPETTGPPRWLWIAIAVTGLMGLAYVYLPIFSPTETPTTSVVVATSTTLPAAVTSRLAASDLTTTTTAPTTTTTQAPVAPVVVAQPTTTTSQAPTTTTTEAPTTTTTEAPTATTVGAVGEHVHGELVDPGEVCHTHDGTVAEHCHTVEYPSTTAPDPAASGDCPGNYHQWYKVRDDCLLSEVRREMLAFQAGSHAQRMAAIRDGHLLGRVFTESQTSAEQRFGTAEANDLDAWTSVWADADNRSTRRVELYGAQWIGPSLIHVRIRTVMRDGSFAWAWNVVPFTYVDGEWKISYQGFCRRIDGAIGFVRDHGGTLNPCPPDPRPNLVVWEDVVASYGPTDDPTRTANYPVPPAGNGKDSPWHAVP